MPASLRTCDVATRTAGRTKAAGPEVYAHSRSLINRLWIELGKALSFSIVAGSTYAHEISDRLSISGVAAGAVQCQEISNAPGFSDTCKGTLPFQTELSFRPTDAGELFVKLGLAAGNGMNGRSPFAIAPWAADLEHDVENINGHNRDHLLTAWYKHTLQVGGEHTLDATLGIIDATDYLDKNAYASDEYTQFMNAALTNGPNVFLPSYDLGLALAWNRGPWSARGVLMDVGENDDGHRFSFLGVETEYDVESELGSGHYRFLIAAASRNFLDPTGTRWEHRAGVLFSLDQELGRVLGSWARIGWQTNEAAVDYNAIYSWGIDVKGSAWTRNDDNIGLGLAYLSGGSLAIDRSRLAEFYYRWQVMSAFALTVSFEYQHDDLKVGNGPHGWTYGLRAVAGF